MNENLGDYILSVHIPGAIMDVHGETLDVSSTSENPFVQAVLSMIAAAAQPAEAQTNSKNSV